MLREPTGGDAATDDEVLIEYLESDQLVEYRSHPVELARLSRSATIGLWALRVWVTVLSAMVLYAFVTQLGH